MDREDVSRLKDLTGAEIAQWCAEHKQMVMIDYVLGLDGKAHALIRSMPEPPELVNLPALLRRQAE